MVAIRLKREFLHVTLDVMDPKTFEEKVRLLLPLFEMDAHGGEPGCTDDVCATVGPVAQAGASGFRWRHILAGRRQLEDKRAQFVHLWRVPSPPNLGTAMHILATDRDYADLHDTVVAETQELAHLERAYSPNTLDYSAQDASGCLLREVFELKPSRRSVAKYQMRMRLEVTREMQKRHGWRLLVAIQHVTGRLGTRVNFWWAPKESLAGARRDFECLELNNTTATGDTRTIDVFEIVDYRARENALAAE